MPRTAADRGPHHSQLHDRRHHAHGEQERRRRTTADAESRTDTKTGTALPTIHGSESGPQRRQKVPEIRSRRMHRTH